MFFFILNVLGKHGTGEKRMGKVDDYTAGRSQGLILAREIVKKRRYRGTEKRNPVPEYHGSQYGADQKRVKYRL